jgi:hypothetical protein
MGTGSGLDGIFSWPSTCRPAILFDQPTVSWRAAAIGGSGGKKGKEATSYARACVPPPPRPSQDVKNTYSCCPSRAGEIQSSTRNSRSHCKSEPRPTYNRKSYCKTEGLATYNRKAIVRAKPGPLTIGKAIVRRRGPPLSIAKAIVRASPGPLTMSKAIVRATPAHEK